jgi:hypothetical protein
MVAGCSKQTAAAPPEDKVTQATAPAAHDDSPPEIEPADEPPEAVIDNDESAGVKDPPAGDEDDPEAESDQGDYE